MQSRIDPGQAAVVRQIAGYPQAIAATRESRRNSKRSTGTSTAFVRRPCRTARGGAGRRSHGDPGVYLAQVETERAFESRTHEANGAQRRVADLALDLGLRVVTRGAFMNRGACRKLGVPHEAHPITVSSDPLSYSAHRSGLALEGALSLYPRSLAT
jgi:hypothetical protein